MTDARAWLIETARHVVAGGDIDAAALDAVIPDPRDLIDGHQKRIWEALSHWADDDDIRVRDPRYCAAMRARLGEHLAALLAEP